MSIFKTGTLLIAIMVILGGCATTQNTTDDKQTDTDNLTLRERLERKGGVSLRGYEENTTVELRGGRSISDRGKQPLFVVDGNKWGRDFYRVAQSLETEKIKSVRIMNNPSMYGNQGSHGVIEITTYDTD